MKTGVILLAQHRVPDESRIAGECADYIRSKGHPAVRVAYFRGSAPPFDVMQEMNSKGVDTFCILPLVVSEGKMSVWDMPAALHLPDNCGSWTMIGDRDVATRFATALGRDPRMATALVGREGEPDGSAILLVSRGSPHSTTAKVAEYYAEAFRQAGWRAECSFCTHGESPITAAGRLREEGYARFRVVPLYISFTGRSAVEVRDALAGPEVSYSEALGNVPAFRDILESKVPEGW